MAVILGLAKEKKKKKKKRSSLAIIERWLFYRDASQHDICYVGLIYLGLEAKRAVSVMG